MSTLPYTQQINRAQLARMPAEPLRDALLELLQDDERLLLLRDDSPDRDEDYLPVMILHPERHEALVLLHWMLAPQREAITACLRVMQRISRAAFDDRPDAIPPSIAARQEDLLERLEHDEMLPPQAFLDLVDELNRLAELAEVLREQRSEDETIEDIKPALLLARRGFEAILGLLDDHEHRRPFRPRS